MMIITTKSGSEYIFSKHDGNLWISKGLMEGIVIKHSVFEIGSILEVYFRKMNCFGELDSYTSFLRTTDVIVSIS